MFLLTGLSNIIHCDSVICGFWWLHNVA